MHGDMAALAACYRIHIRNNHSACHAAGNRNRGIILLSAVDTVRNLIICGDVIHLGSRLTIQPSPGLSAVKSDIGAAVISVDHSLVIFWINPEIVIVSVKRLRNGVKRFSAIHRF